MKTQRPAGPAISIGLGLAAASGILGVLHASRPDREALRAEFSREIDRAEALPAEDPVKKDRRIEELLAAGEHETHARALWLRLERLHGPAHRAAQADEAARRSVPPFLARCSALDGKTPAELRSLDDEARSLQDVHGFTRFGTALVEVRGRLSTALAACLQSCNELEHFHLLQDIQTDRIAGRFAEAQARLDVALPKHSVCEPFLLRLQNERRTLLASATRAAEVLLEGARKDRGNGQKDEAAQGLERALPNFKGFPEEGRLRALLAELRRP
ncbi:MAG TPA: hypothetical protein VMU54_15790 [Planctomycetota bacterium]|nr:hypothetical protein [Planctomycetota bacterium]